MKFTLKSFALVAAVTFAGTSFGTTTKQEDKQGSSWVKPAVITAVVVGAAFGADIYLNGLEGSYTKAGFNYGLNKTQQAAKYLWSFVPYWESLNPFGANRVDTIAKKATQAFDATSKLEDFANVVAPVVNA